MANKIKLKLNQNWKSHTSCLVTTINSLLNRPNKELIPPVLSFNQTQADVQHKIKKLFDFNVNPGEVLEFQKRVH